MRDGSDCNGFLKIKHCGYQMRQRMTDQHDCIGFVKIKHCDYHRRPRMRDQYDCKGFVKTKHCDYHRRPLLTEPIDFCHIAISTGDRERNENFVCRQGFVNDFYCLLNKAFDFECSLLRKIT